MTRLLVYDLETSDLDINKASIKWVLTYDPQTNIFNMFDYEEMGPNKIRSYLMQYDKLIGFNSNQYDIPILCRHNILYPDDFCCNHFIKGIDVYEIFKKRGTLIFPRGFESLSLAAINKKLWPNSIEQKGEIDYNLFKKRNCDLTIDELNIIKKYGEMDVKLTWKLWEYLVDKFEPFGEFIPFEDVRKFKHINSSTASFGYKALCYGAQIPELWGNTEIDQDAYVGAFVMEPTKEVARGNILYLDYASLYPMIYVHANLFSSKCSCCSQEEKWHGDNNWKVEGYYCKKNQGKIENVVKRFYLLRKEYKKIGDTREQAIKIILNSLYGSSARPGFTQTYSPTTASDCCFLAQQIIKYSIKQLEDNDFGKVLMSDTDSIVIELANNKTKEECLEFCKNLSRQISSTLPFPWEEFNLKLESEVKYIQFFKDDEGKLKKKNYIYVDKDKKIVVKGLDIIQRDCSKLSQLIFEKHLKEQIINNLDCKFSRKYIESLVKEELSKDMLLIAKKFNIRFKYDCDTSLYNDILSKYGAGEYYLVKNLSIGAGKSKKYCSLEEAKNLNFNHLDMSDVWKELNPFIKEEQMRLF